MSKTLLSLGKLNRSIKWAKAAYKADPNRFYVADNYVSILLKANKKKRAKRVMKEFNRKNPEHKDNWKLVAMN